MTVILDYLSINAKNILNLWLTMQLQTGLFILIILAIDLSLRKASPRFRYLLWSTALLKAFLPPIVAMPSAAEGAIARMTLPIIDVRASGAPIAAAGMSIETMLVLGLLLLAFALGLLVLFRSASLHRGLREANPLQHDAWEAGPPVFVARRIPSPVAVGVLRPRIYVTPDIADGPKNILHAVLYHERAHVRRRDGLVVVLQSLIQIFYVLNPLVWLLNLRLFRYREQICDAEALRQAETRPQDYGRLLLRYAEAQPSRLVQTGTCFFETRRGFVQRVSQLFHTGEGSKMKHIQRAAIVILLVLIAPLSWRCSDDTITYEETQYSKAEHDFVDQEGQQETGAAPGDPATSRSEYEEQGNPKHIHSAQIVGGLEALSKRIVYPEQALKLNLSGIVLISVRVVKDGPCESAEIIRSTQSVLDQAALDAVHGVRFKAARRNGNIVESDMTIPIKFKLK